MARRKLINLKELPEFERVIKDSLKTFYLDDVYSYSKKLNVNLNNKIELFVLLIYMQSEKLIGSGNKTINTDLVCKLEKIAEHSRILADLIDGLPQYGVREWFEGGGKAQSSRDSTNPAVQQCGAWVGSANYLVSHFGKIQNSPYFNFADMIVSHWFDALQLRENVCDSYSDFAERLWGNHLTQLKNIAASILAFSEQPELSRVDAQELIANRAKTIGNNFNVAFPVHLKEVMRPIDARLKYLGNNSKT